MVGLQVIFERNSPSHLQHDIIIQNIQVIAIVIIKILFKLQDWGAEG